MRLREPLILPVAAIMLGIVFTRFWPVDARYLVVAAAAVSALALFCWLRKFAVTGMAACLAAFLFAGALLEISHDPGPAPKLSVPDLATTILDGCVVEPPVFTGEKEAFVLELGPHARARVTMYVRKGEQPPALRYGQNVEVTGNLRLPRNFGNPEAFDYRYYLARQDIFWGVSGQSVTVLPGKCGNPLMAAVYAVRTASLDRIAELYKGDRYDIAMMDAVLIGESSLLDKVWTEDYRSTGTFHALVISGSHVAVLAGVFLFLLRLCFIPRPYATLLTVLAAWFYALLTGWQPPVIRSAVAMSLYAFAGFFFRDRRTLNILAGVALLFVVFDPEQVFDPSFQLSFLAVVFLGVFAVPILEHTSEPLVYALRGLADARRDVHLEPRVAEHRVELRLLAATLSALTRISEAASIRVVVVVARIGLFFYEIFVTSAIIQAALALPMVIYFHRASFTGLSANALIIPLLGLVIPIGFVALATGWHWVAWIAAFLLDISRRTAAWHAALEPNWRIPSPPFWLSLGICAALALVAIRWKRASIRYPAIALFVALLAVLIAHPFAPRIEPRNLELTAIDVGQGDSLFLAFPDGHTMLMDTGGIPQFGHTTPVRMDIGEDVVAPYLWTRSIRRLDTVAITHLHDDHMGGLLAILNDFQVGELWVGATPPCAEWDAIQCKARERGTKIRWFKRGENFPWGGARIEVLAPAPDYTPRKDPSNDDSLVLRVAYGQRSLLLTGDMERPVEIDLAYGGMLPHADILKVGHHGSKSSSTPELLDRVRPGLALISDGHGNLYNHPHPVTLQALADRHIYTQRTDLTGMITVVTDGQRIWVE